MVYINLNPLTGDGGYIIGEGLNGGYTVEQWSDGWGHLWRTHSLLNLIARIITPVPGQTFAKGDIIKWHAYYENTFLGDLFYAWNEEIDIKTDPLPGDLIIGTNILKTGYGTNQSVEVVIRGPQTPTQLICHSELDNRTLPATSGMISEEMHLPLWINKSSGIYKQRLNNQVQYNKQDDIYTHSTSFPDFFQNLTGLELTVNNINNPWINPKDGKYWNMSITYAAFDIPAKERDHEKYYMNMRWGYNLFSIPEIYKEKDWYFGKKVWIKNPATGKAVVAGILDWGPSETTGSVAGASPEALKAIGAQQGSAVEFCWAEQDLSYGSVINY